jgi:hypothetical protein
MRLESFWVGVLVTSMALDGAESNTPLWTSTLPLVEEEDDSAAWSQERLGATSTEYSSCWRMQHPDLRLYSGTGRLVTNETLHSARKWAQIKLVKSCQGKRKTHQPALTK